MQISPRWIPAALACAALTFGGIEAQAAYPTKAVHLMVGFAPGGGTDVLARLIATKLSQKWGQPVVVENRDGADGSIAADLVSHSAPDGYNIAVITNAHTVTPNEFKLNYDPVKSFAPITMIAEAPDVLVVNPTLPVNSLKELIAYAKANPGKLNFGTSGGIGTSPYLEMELLMKLTGIKMVNVSYKGGGPTMIALLGNDIQLAFAAVSTSMGQIQGKQVKPLAVSVKQRVPQFPDVPTVAEAANLPGYDVSVWYGMLAPAGTPKEIVQKIHDDIAEAVNSDDLKKVMDQRGFITVMSSPEQFTKTISEDLTRWSSLLKEVKESEGK